MDINHTYWEENSNAAHLMKYESCNSNDDQATTARLKDEPLYRCCDSNLNFATVACSEDDSEFGQYKKNKVSRQDPMSHRIIEKRRRDRMNNCLADLSRLIPADYLKKGRGRIEKTEIIEMAIKHIKYLQQMHKISNREENERPNSQEQYRLGYQECMSETMRFLVEVEGYFAREALCVRLINHLQKHCDDLLLREHISSSTNEKSYSQSQSVPTLISNNVNNNTNNSVIKNHAPPTRPTSDHYETNMHLKDILAANIIKDEVQEQLSVNSQTFRPHGNENLVVPITRVSSPDNEKNSYQKQMEYSFQKFRTNGNETKMEERERKISETESYDKNRECSNGASLYKFKNNIKQRFSQDLNAETNQLKVFKRRKLSEPIRRTSLTTETYSSENHSSPMDGSQCSPPSSETYRISSESENARISPTGSSVSDIRNVERRTPNRYVGYKTEPNSIKSHKGYDRYSPMQQKSIIKNMPVIPSSDTEKTNFGVPIFALHAKGSFYIPLTIDYHTLIPYLQHHNVLDVLPNVHNIILHPVTINVNFQSNYFNSINTRTIKTNKHKLDVQNGWH